MEKKKKRKKITLKNIEFENCEPMTSMPSIGDIIAFKMLTYTTDNNCYESSPFNTGSVLSLNEDTQMVDILLSDVIKRSESYYNIIRL